MKMLDCTPKTPVQANKYASQLFEKRHFYQFNVNYNWYFARDKLIAVEK